MLRNRLIKQIRLGDRGVNLWDPLPLFGEGEAVLTQNCYWRHGLTMKKGSVKHSATEVVASKPIVGLHRFYYGTASKVLLATCGTLTKKMNDGTGAWTDVGAPAATDSTPSYFTTWAAVNKCYVANGVNQPFAVTSAEMYESIATPINAAFTTGAGTLATATYYYRVSALNANGQTLASAETSLAVTGPVGINVNWGAVTGATGYKVYGRSTGAELLIATVGAVTTYLDDGSITPSGALPTENTAFLIAAPSTTKMFLPYRDRLLSIDRTDPSYLRWSGSYDDTTWTSTTQAMRVPGSGVIEAITLHSLDQTDTGLDAKVLVTKATSLYLFSGTDLAPASGTYNARLDPIGGGENVGSDAPRTIVATPKGTILLGNDNQVYLLPFGSTQITPIGHNIIRQDPATSDVKGLESLTATNRPKACATYHDGFYKLSFATSGSTNNVQYWLDVNRLAIGETGHATPWYGPMNGMNIAVFALQNGAGDTHKLLGGEATSLGFVYNLNDSGTYTDNLTAITSRFTSRHEPNIGVDVRVMKTELELTDPDNLVALSFLDTTGQVGSTHQMAPEPTGVYFNEVYFGEAYFAGGNALVRRVAEHYEHYMVGRMLATSLVYTSSTDRIEIQKCEHEVKPYRQSFAVRA